MVNKKCTHLLSKYGSLIFFFKDIFTIFPTHFLIQTCYAESKDKLSMREVLTDNVL